MTSRETRNCLRGLQIKPACSMMKHTRQGRIQNISSKGRGEGSWQLFFSHQGILQRAVRTSLKKQLDPKGSNCFSMGGSYMYQCFLKKIESHGIRIPVTNSGSAHARVLILWMYGSEHNSIANIIVERLTHDHDDRAICIFSHNSLSLTI